MELGGVPVYYPLVLDATGNAVEDKSRDSADDRRALGIGFTAWWLDKDVPNTTQVFATDAAKKAGFKEHPAGYRCGRFITSEYLREGDELIPLIAGKSKSGKELAAAAVLKFGGAGGAVVVSGLQAGFGPIAHTEGEQARFLVRSAAIALAEGVEKFFPQWTRLDGTRAGMVWTVNGAGEAVLEFDQDGIVFSDMFGADLPVRSVDAKRYSVVLSDSPVYFRGGALVSEPFGKGTES